MPSKVLDEARDLVKKRLAELEDERSRLERALSERDGKAGGTGRRPGRTRKVGRPAKKAKAAARPRRTRRRRSNTRADQAVQMVEKNPGISAYEIAKSRK